MPAYVVVQITVKDSARYEQYRAMAPGSIAQYGGRYIARGGATETLEGDWKPNRLVILEFPTMEQARAWYQSPEYADAMALRHATAESQMVLVEGL